ncbi:MAG: hypothetical protein BYD32DRAFT_230877 [Podila humilis]|nr:MAG: hypothetical protein BYD32DRAFT_230877 [Podila humilis]
MGHGPRLVFAVVFVVMLLLFVTHHSFKWFNGRLVFLFNSSTCLCGLVCLLYFCLSLSLFLSLHLLDACLDSGFIMHPDKGSNMKETNRLFIGMAALIPPVCIGT